MTNSSNSNNENPDAGILGKIDLSLINLRTRPDRKAALTKEPAIDIKTEIENFLFSTSHSDKKLTEIYLGFEEIEWFFSKAKYSATCTEAIDFTLFDKTICGLLQIEEHLSLEQIGEILGFNVVDNPSQKKYKDLAEYEILKEALQSLQEFEMIDGGDIDFSYCTLTAIGKEYVTKGKKFKTHQNKTFELYFDYTSSQHLNAKDNFEFIKGVRVENGDCKINFEDEEFLKTFAKSQIPQIYNPDTLSSFKDSECINVSHFKTILYRIYILDITNGKLSSIVFEPTSKYANDFFSEYDCKRINHKTFIDFVNSNYQLQDYNIEKNNIAENLTNYQKKINVALEEKSTEEAIAILDEYYKDSLFIEPEIFFNNISKFIEFSKQEIWFLLKDVSKKEIDAIKNLTINSKEKYFFIYLENNEISQQLYDEINKANEQFQNVYILLMDSVVEFNVLFKSDNKTWNVFKRDRYNIPISINGDLHQIEKYFLCRNITEFDLEEKYLNKYRVSFAKEYVPIVDKNIKVFFNELNTDDETGKDKIAEINNIDTKLLPFKNLGNSRNYFQSLERQKQLAINSILQNRMHKITSDIEKLSKKFTENANPTIGFIEKIEAQIEKEKEKCLDEEFTLFVELEAKLKITKKDIEIASQRKSIIIDTNILLEEPNIIEIIGQQQTIIFSGKVIDELDNLKVKPDLKDKAQNAIRNIHKHRQDKNIRFNTSKIDNLPSDFNKKSPDNIILSVALQYMKRNPVILTNDKGMSIKAETLEIPAKNITELKNILGMKKQAKSTNKNRTNKRRK